jgi:hypothetical protein
MTSLVWLIQTMKVLIHNHNGEIINYVFEAKNWHILKKFLVKNFRAQNLKIAVSSIKIAAQSIGPSRCNTIAYHINSHTKIIILYVC